MLFPPPKSATKPASRPKQAKPQQHPASGPKLNSAMACDTAFRIIARRHLEALRVNEEATCEGHPAALHQMRVALTHLRTAVRFFSPMVVDAIRNEVRDELKWLNGELGAVRDLDVTIERIQSLTTGKHQDTAPIDPWIEKRLQAHRELARTLRSGRYHWLIEQTSSWIENGPWSTKKSKEALTQRAMPIGVYSSSKLKQWEEKLLKKSRRLLKMGTKERHRLRLLNKKLTYSIDSFKDLFGQKSFSRQKVALKHLRKAQRSLGQLNDGARGKALVREMQESGVQTHVQFLGPKRKKRLLEIASDAYRKLDELT